MDQIEKDDFIHALTQTMGFYGKEINKMQTTFWVDACREYPVEKLKLALRQHIQIGKYAPRPADILELCRTMAPQARQAALPPPAPESNCPPDIAAAWAWFIKVHSGHEFGKVPRPDPETEERYLHIVNHEALKYEMPEAIPEEYRLQEVWG